ncbi:acetate--CoA ligase family protein [Snodgrassella sp. CFCC 13594]|uniref:acetate--CoA ligase family protein n=1 Tax=Snodgrassella sp. CFCC 13594 TaxID=1775559 RepID=UPI000B2ADC14|nr:acetate--CoA ligase family protein [Snodgrassella sp. CFCC 13594]
MKPHPLHSLFAPKHIAVIGASDKSNSAGQRLLANLLASAFKGKITPVNIRHKMVGGLTAYANVTQIPQAVDVAIVLTRIDSLAAIFKDCHKAGIRYVILVKTLEHVQPKDREVLKKAVDRAKKLGVRVLGPSLLGLIRSNIGLNASIYSGHINPGNLAVISQSSALCTAMLDWAYSRDIGFSTVLSLGETTWDVDFGEILDYLVNDSATKAILLHINQVTDGRQFLSALRAAARAKPIVVIKSGHNLDHVTGLTQASRALKNADVFASILARAGVLQVNSISQMFTAVKVLTANYRSHGDKLAIICNGIGLGILAADTAYDLGVPLATLSEGTLSKLNEALPENWSRSNPVDVVGDAGPLRFRTAVKLCLDDDQVDGVLVIFSPQIGTDHLATAQMMVQLQSETEKPLLLSWLGEQKVKESRALFTQAKRLHFNAPDNAIEVFKKLADFHHNQQLLLQTPAPLTQAQCEPDYTAAHRLLHMLQDAPDTIVSEALSKQLLGLFGIHTNQTLLAQNEAASCALADKLGYPVVLKIDSPDLFYKSDIDGVRLNLNSREEVCAAYQQMIQAAQRTQPPIRINGVTVQPMYRHKYAREMAISVTRDPTFGPIITLGAGGWAGNLQQQRAVSLPPLNDILIQDMLSHTAIGHTLGTFKNMPPIDKLALHHALLRISEMVCELPEIEEMEIDPFMVTPDGVMALDARMVINKQKKSPRRYGIWPLCPIHIF